MPATIWVRTSVPSFRFTIPSQSKIVSGLIPQEVDYDNRVKQGIQAGAIVQITAATAAVMIAAAGGAAALIIDQANAKVAALAEFDTAATDANSDGKPDGSTENPTEARARLMAQPKGDLLDLVTALGGDASSFRNSKKDVIVDWLIANGAVDNNYCGIPTTHNERVLFTYNVSALQGKSESFQTYLSANGRGGDASTIRGLAKAWSVAGETNSIVEYCNLMAGMISQGWTPTIAP